MEHNTHIVAVDATNIIHWLYHATEDARVVPNAFFDFVKTLERKYSVPVVLAFDSDYCWRKLLYPGYKSSRPEKPEDLIEALSYIQSAASHEYQTVSEEYFEAEDCIAELVEKQIQAGFGCCIVSSDKDLKYLIDDEKMIFVFDPRKKEEVKERQCYVQYNVWPDQMKDYLALVGDSSDDVPGCPGIGKVTAAELLNAFGSIKGIMDEIEYEKNPDVDQKIKQGVKKKIIDNINLVRLSYQLVSLKSPSKLNIDALKEQCRVKEEESTLEPAVAQEPQPQQEEMEIANQPEPEQESSPVQESQKITIKEALEYIFKEGLEIDVLDVKVVHNEIEFSTKEIRCPIVFDVKTFGYQCRTALQKRNSKITIASGETGNGGLCLVVVCKNEQCTEPVDFDFVESMPVESDNYVTKRFDGRSEIESIIKAVYRTLKDN